MRIIMTTDSKTIPWGFQVLNFLWLMLVIYGYMDVLPQYWSGEREMTLARVFFMAVNLVYACHVLSELKSIFKRKVNISFKIEKEQE